MKRSGTADLPLHWGKVPEWLHSRMRLLGKEIITAIVEEFGPDEVLQRISDPFWFQALGCVMGMDWHSSGITTSVMGALKQAINPISNELGLYICGGRGKHSRQTPDELTKIAMKTGHNGHELVYASRMSAKVDNNCIQDGFSLYLHNFMLSKSGKWAVVQQGMNDFSGMARRYHWHSSDLKSFVSDPHTAIIGTNLGEIVNLSDSRAAPAQSSIIDFLKHPVTVQINEMRHLVMDRPHEIKEAHVNSQRLGAVLATAYDKQISQFTDFLMLEGVGPRTIQSLALVSEVIYGKPCRFSDPARFAFAHGGKDGHPFPVPLKTYDESIGVLRRAVEKAKLGVSDKLKGIEKLHKMALSVEKNNDPFADVNKLIQHERNHSYKYGGMTVKGMAMPPKKQKDAEQLSLFD
jgi:hypothetical protein